MGKKKTRKNSIQVSVLGFGGAESSRHENATSNELLNAL